MPASAILVAAASSGFGLMSARAPAGTGFRKTALASLIALSVAACTAQASDDGPRLVNRNGDQEVVHARPPRGNVADGAHAAIAGGGEDMVHSAAPGARVGEPRLVGRLAGVGEDARVVYAAPPAADTVTAARPGAPNGG